MRCDLPQDPVCRRRLYFAYGANLASQTLKKRGLEPLAWAPAQIIDPNVFLVFGHRGGFATLHQVQDSSAHSPNLRWFETLLSSPETETLLYQQPYGVVYDISEAQLRKIERYEVGYQCQGVRVQLLHTGPGRSFLTQQEYHSIEAVAFVSSPWLTLRRPVAPPERYRDLLLQGAREKGLGAFGDWLSSLPTVGKTASSSTEYNDTIAQSAAMAFGILLFTVCTFLVIPHRGF